MPLYTPENIRVPAGGDSYALTADLREMANSIGGIVAVANTSARTALVNARIAESRPVTAADPLVVLRGDAAPRREIEYSIDGSNWRTIEASNPKPRMFYRTTFAAIPHATTVDLSAAWSARSGDASGASGLPYSGGIITATYAGWYQTHIRMFWSGGSGSTATRHVYLKINGSSVDEASQIIDGMQALSCLNWFDAGDTAQVSVRQNTGSALSLRGDHDRQTLWAMNYVGA